MCSICHNNGVPRGVDRKQDSFDSFEESLDPHKPQDNTVVTRLESLDNRLRILGIQNADLVPVNG